MGDIQERIAQAKKEAEELKEKIKQKKEALADTTRMFFPFFSAAVEVVPFYNNNFFLFFCNDHQSGLLPRNSSLFPGSR